MIRHDTGNMVHDTENMIHDTGDTMHDTGDRVHCTGSNLRVRLCKVCYHSVRGHGSMVILKVFRSVYYIPII